MIADRKNHNDSFGLNSLNDALLEEINALLDFLIEQSEEISVPEVSEPTPTKLIPLTFSPEFLAPAN